MRTWRPLVLPLLLAVPCSALLPHAGVACSARRAIYPSSSSLWATSKERKEEIEEKLAALRRAKNQGNTYESLVGKGKSFAEEAEKKLSTLGKGEGKADDGVVFRGKTEQMESELTMGRRNTVIEDEASATLPMLLEIAEKKASGFDPNSYDKLMNEAESFLSSKDLLQAMGGLEGGRGNDGGVEGGNSDDSNDLIANAMGADIVEEAQESFNVQSTGSVGGKWSAPTQEVETHSPKVSTWGLFDRPKDISKAYGGGRDPRVPKSPEETKMKDQKIADAMKSYRQAAGLNDPLVVAEPENEPKMTAALSSARRSMRSGDIYGAVQALESVIGLCSPCGDKGGEMWLELGMALEATGESDRANAIYKSLGRCNNETVRKNARQLRNGMQAMETLRLGPSDGPAEQSQLSKLVNSHYASMEPGYGYSSAYFGSTTYDADGKSSKARVANVEDALDLLLEAHSKGRITDSRVNQALLFLMSRSNEVSELSSNLASMTEDSSEPESTVPITLLSLVGEPETMPARLCGKTWRLRLRSSSSTLDPVPQYFGFGSSGSLNFEAGGAFKSVEPVAPLIQKDRKGTWELDTDSRVFTFTFEAVGVAFLSVAWEDTEQPRLIALSEEKGLLITMDSKDYSVWTTVK